MSALTDRVHVGAFYTDGRRLAEVTRVYDLGHVAMLDALTGDYIGVGIIGFRAEWWLVREGAA